MVGVLYLGSSVCGFLATGGGTLYCWLLVVFSMLVVMVVLLGELGPDGAGTPIIDRSGVNLCGLSSRVGIFSFQWWLDVHIHSSDASIAP